MHRNQSYSPPLFLFIALRRRGCPRYETRPNLKRDLYKRMEAKVWMRVFLASVAVSVYCGWSLFYSVHPFVPYSKRICHKLLWLRALETESERKRERTDWHLRLDNNGQPFLLPSSHKASVVFLEEQGVRRKRSDEREIQIHGASDVLLLGQLSACYHNPFWSSLS